MVLPSYQEDQATYRADTCGPVEQAAAAGRLRLEALARGQYPGRRLPRTALPGLKTVGFWDAAEQQDWRLDWHRNEGIELTYLESGSVRFGVDGSDGLLKPGDLTVTRPWQQHCVGEPTVGACRLHWLILDLGVRRPHQPWRWPTWIVLTREDLRALTEILRHNEQPVWHAEPAIGHCFRRIAGAVGEEEGRGNLSRISVHVNELLLLVLEMLRRRKVKLDETLASSLRTVELFWQELRQRCDWLAHEWSVGGMAKRCGLGVTQFIHRTRQLYNLTPAHYLLRCRLDVAGRMLTERPDASITEIALGCGFSSSQYFATLFRRQFGKTPRQWRSGD